MPRTAEPATLAPVSTTVPTTETPVETTVPATDTTVQAEQSAASASAENIVFIIAGGGERVAR